MEFGTNINRQSVVPILRAYINPTTDIIDWGYGQNVRVRLPEYELFTYRVFLKGKLPIGLENNRIYYFQRQLGGSNPNLLFLSTDDIDNNNPFDFTTENLEGFVSCEAWTVDYKHTPFPCVETAAIDVEDMFCCPPLVPDYRPEYITLNTGSGDDSGDYYPNEYPITSGDSAAGNNYKSRNRAYVPITRMQANIYAGPIVYGTYEDTYTLRWEITTEVGDIGSDTPPGPIGPAGYKRNRVKLFISANFHWNPVVYNDYGDYKFPQSISLEEIYASPWVLLKDFSYSATCTLIGNDDTNYMYPSAPDYYAGPPPVPIYYDTPAGLPIPHTVTLTPSSGHTVFPDKVRLVLKDAKFLTPATVGDSTPSPLLNGFYGSIPLGDFDIDLTFNETLGGFYSQVLTLYGIKGRFSLGGISHLTKTRWEDYTLRGYGVQYAFSPETLYCNDIETNRGPLRGRTLPGAIISSVSLVAGIGHGNAFFDSRWKIHAIYSGVPHTPPTSTYFSWTEKNWVMEVAFSQYSSAIKRPYGYSGDFFHTNFFRVYSDHPDSYYSSLVTLPVQPGTPPPPS
jgi:hypothetical protein